MPENTDMPTRAWILRIFRQGISGERGSVRYLSSDLIDQSLQRKPDSRRTVWAYSDRCMKTLSTSELNFPMRS